MSNLRLRKTIIGILLPLIVSGCAPMLPDNYLGPSNIRTPQKVNGKWISPRIIPISTQMLNSPDGQLLLAPAMRPQPYRVGSFDNLSIIVWGHPEFSTVATAPIINTTKLSLLAAMGGAPSSGSTGTITSNTAILVDSDGKIFFPYVGELPVANLTVAEIQYAIAQRLKRYVRNPQVTVQVTKFRNRHAYVLGEVMVPGMHPLTDKPLTLMEAISAAGGINTSTADPTHIYLVRGSYEKPDIFWLNAESPQSLMIAEHFPLQENDIVYVSGAMLNPLNNFIGRVIPTFTTYFTVKALANQ